MQVGGASWSLRVCIFVFRAMRISIQDFLDQHSLPLPSSARQVCLHRPCFLSTTICSKCIRPSHGFGYIWLSAPFMLSALFCGNSLYTANILGAKGLTSETFAPVRASVCRSFYPKNSAPSAVLFRVRSPSAYCDVPESLEDRNGGYCLAKES